MTSSKEDDYWGRYYAKVYNKRITLTDIVQHATTANFGCHSSVFESTQGFPTEYKHYGFEDRDFLINATLQCQQSEILYDPRLIASNNDRTSLEEITKKMQESARYSATIFKRRYPEVYKKTAYAKLDLNEHNRVIISCYRILRPLLTLIQKGTIGLFKLEWLPFSCRAFLTKLASGLAYLDGSYLAWHSKVKKD